MAVPFCDFCGCTSARDPATPNCFGIQPFPNFLSVRSGPEGSPLLEPLPEIIAVDASFPEVFYDPGVPYYNMTGQKMLYIFCDECDNDTSCLDNCFRRPTSTEGVRDEAEAFSKTIDLYGFTVRLYYNMDREKIISVISRVSQQDHIRTSCVWVAMMCQATGNTLHAADGSYGLSDIVFLLQSKNLAGIPKILTVPSLRGGKEMPGLCAWLPPQGGSMSCLPCEVIMNLWYGCSDWFHERFGQDECPKCQVCGACNSDNGHTVRLASGGTMVRPKTSDLFIMHAPNNDLNSICVLMRAIREILQEEKVELEHGDLIPKINQKVSDNTAPGEDIVIPETRITLTNTLRFTRTVSHRN